MPVLHVLGAGLADHARVGLRGGQVALRQSLADGLAANGLVVECFRWKGDRGPKVGVGVALGNYGKCKRCEGREAGDNECDLYGCTIY